MVDDASADAERARADAIALAEQAEAEAAEAEALAAAARARARAIKLRREAEAEREAESVREADAERATRPEPEADDTEPPEAAVASEDEDAETAGEHEPVAAESETDPARRITVARVLLASALATILALLGASGWMAWQHRRVDKEHERAAAFIATARQGVVNLTSLDFNRAQEDVQRVLDTATGEFKDDFQKRAEDFASVVKDSKAVTEGSVAASAVESMTNDSAVVLVLANERVTNIAGAKDQPRTFRFRVSVVHDGGDLKVSKVEFVL